MFKNTCAELNAMDLKKYSDVKQAIVDYFGSRQIVEQHPWTWAPSEKAMEKASMGKETARKTEAQAKAR